ncbi:MAG TPA: hypothetical protein VII13_07350 [Vicinamibacteria bacterium]
MSSPPDPAPAVPPDDPRAGTRALLVLTAFTAALLFLTHHALVRSRAFLELCRQHAYSWSNRPLFAEATLRLLDPGQAEVIVVGSSVVESHFDDAMLASALGLAPDQVVGLALAAAQTIEPAMMLPQLESRRPRLVVYPATVWILFDRPDFEALRVYDPRVAWSLFRWPELRAGHEAHASKVLGSLHFGIRHRGALRSVIGEVVAEKAGWSEGPPPPVPAEADAVGRRLFARIRARPDQFTCPNVQVRALTLMARRLAAAGILLVIVATPVNNEWDARPALRDRLEACLADVARDTGALLVQRRELPPFGPADFVDSQHLSVAGKRRFTDGLGRLLSVRLGLGGVRGPDAVQ